MSFTDFPIFRFSERQRQDQENTEEHCRKDYPFPKVNGTYNVPLKTVIYKKYDGTFYFSRKLRLNYK